MSSDDGVPSVVLAPDRSIIESFIQIILYGEECQPKELAKLHSKRERAVYSSILCRYEVHCEVGTAFDNRSSAIEQVKHDLILISCPFPVLATKFFDLFHCGSARELHRVEVVWDDKEEVKGEPDVEPAEPLSCEDEGGMFGAVVQCFKRVLTLGSVISKGDLSSVCEAQHYLGHSPNRSEVRPLALFLVVQEAENTSDLW